MDLLEPHQDVVYGRSETLDPHKNLPHEVKQVDIVIDLFQLFLDEERHHLKSQSDLEYGVVIRVEQHITCKKLQIGTKTSNVRMVTYHDLFHSIILLCVLT